MNLGDDSSDNINVGGDFVSGLRPDVSDSFDLGLLGQKWRNLFLSGYVSTDEIKNSTNTPSISLQPNGNVVVEESLTVNGDLLVTGTSTQVNTSELVVKIEQSNLVLLMEAFQHQQQPGISVFSLTIMMELLRRNLQLHGNNPEKDLFLLVMLMMVVELVLIIHN